MNRKLPLGASSVPVFYPYTGRGRKRDGDDVRLRGTCHGCDQRDYLWANPTYGVGCAACGAKVAAPGTYEIMLSSTTNAA